MKQMEHNFEVKAIENIRVDKYLSDQLPDISRSRIKRLIEAGNVTLNGELVTKAGTKAKTGDSISMLVVEEDDDGLIPESMPIDILYENDDVIVVNKAAGIVVHPGAGHPSGTLINALLSYYPLIRNVGESDRPGVVHRLDMDTSGVVIFAKNGKTYQWLVRQFKSRGTRKTYLALVDGHPPTPAGRIEAPIIRDPKLRTRMAVGLRGQGKPAVSEYFQLEEFNKHSYLEVHPLTGRTHQIRVHLSYIDVPVVGDMVYGHRHPSIDLDRFFLHAKTLSIKLPGDRAPHVFEAALPEELQAVLIELREKERKSG